MPFRSGRAVVQGRRFSGLPYPAAGAIAQKFYAGGEDVQGKSFFPGYLMGDEGGWGDWVLGNGPGSGYGIQYVQNYFRYMVTDNPNGIS